MSPLRHRDPASRRDAWKGLASEAFRLGLLSLVSVALGYVLTLAMHAAGLGVEMAFGIAIVLCSIVNFFGCRHFVFRGPRPSVWQEASRFFPSVLAFRALEILLFAALNMWLGNHHVAYFATAALGMAAKFIVSRAFIFQRPRRTP